MAWREIIYQYDGSFEGLLCCVFESYTKKERPTAILRDGDDEPSLFEIRAVTTDRAPRAAHLPQPLQAKSGSRPLPAPRVSHLPSRQGDGHLPLHRQILPRGRARCSRA